MKPTSFSWLLATWVACSVTGACHRESAPAPSSGAPPVAPPSTARNLEAFSVEGKWGFRDKTSGQTVIAPRYAMAYEFTSGGIAAVVDNDAWVYINAAGKPVVLPYVVDNGPDPFAEGLARFEKEGKIGFFDDTGRVVLAASFDYAEPFSEGLAAVCQGCQPEREDEHTFMRGGKWGFIDQRGSLVIPFRFDAVMSFEAGEARARIGAETISIDRQGNRKSP